jgi:hypothetical protein
MYFIKHFSDLASFFSLVLITFGPIALCVCLAAPNQEK